MPGKCKYNTAWIAPDPHDVSKARCKLCIKSIDLANMGEAALKSHKTSKKHTMSMEKLKKKDNPSITEFLKTSAGHSTATASKQITSATCETEKVIGNQYLY